MATVVFTDPRFAEHVIAPGHPESPARLDAVARGLAEGPAADSVEVSAPHPAPRPALARVHEDRYLDSLEQFCAGGGGALDADTAAWRDSFDLAVLAAGAGLDAVDRLRAGTADAAFCAVRPPGHHATPSRAMGFCLLNNVAVTAAALADAGERVLIVDIDAHHGNGTQDVFWDDPRVGFVSVHEYPQYPGSGRIAETGGPGAPGTTVNVPVPAHTPGDVYRRILDEVVGPFAANFAPDWLLVSLGFDAHRADPLTDLGLSAGDYGDLLARLLPIVEPRRTVVFLEGGYDLGAVQASTSATIAALAGESYLPEPITTGTVGAQVVPAVVAAHHLG